MQKRKNCSDKCHKSGLCNGIVLKNMRHPNFWLTPKFGIFVWLESIKWGKIVDGAWGEKPEVRFFSVELLTNAKQCAKKSENQLFRYCARRIDTARPQKIFWILPPGKIRDDSCFLSLFPPTEKEKIPNSGKASKFGIFHVFLSFKKNLMIWSISWF